MVKDKEQSFKVYQSGFDKNGFIQMSKGEMKTYLQKQITANVNLNILLGSGASMPSIPTMGQTFNEAKDENTDVENLVKIYLTTKLKENDPKGEDIELFLSWLGNRINGLTDDELQNNEQEIREFVLGKLLGSIVKGSIGTESDDDKIKAVNTEQVYVEFFKNLAHLKQLSDDQHDTINVFTPNYDLFIEKSLAKLGFSYTDGFKNSFESNFDTSEYNRRPVDITQRFRDRWSVVRPYFRVYKLHGSLNWKKNKENKIFKNNDIASGTFIDSVIAPTSSKYADSQGSPFSDLFREFSIELAKPNSILLINGYGFGDEHINDFIIQGLGRPDFKLVAFVEEKNGNEEHTKAFHFMEEVSASAGATFITNPDDSDEKKEAFYFATLQSLLETTSFNASDKQLNGGSYEE